MILIDWIWLLFIIVVLIVVLRYDIERIYQYNRRIDIIERRMQNKFGRNIEIDDSVRMSNEEIFNEIRFRNSLYYISYLLGLFTIKMIYDILSGN